ncbi:hypothetical protein DSO57_1022638 [Entomophthora muscae]|uniref:Uncharacterized protein n=1 Tax=Entomophthora muscae TaxID=34485 RepID=A0ACC2TQL0_9FUNG|nr:hypothetical protein DSO57_1022638 [Entomophthora muscae]
MADVIAIENTNKVDKNDLSSAKFTMIVYLIIFMSSQGFQAFFSIQSVRLRNSYQVLGLLVFNALTLAYSVFQYFQLQKTLEKFNGNENSSLVLLVALVVALVVFCEISLVILGLRLVRDFGWSIYRSIGCDIEMRKMLCAYQSFIVLIELEVFFFGGFMAQLLLFGLGADYKLYINLCITPFVVIIPLISIFGIRKEDKCVTAAALAGYALVPIFALVKIIDICSSGNYKNHHYFLTLFAILTAAFAIASLAVGLVCFFQFGKGLGTQRKPTWVLFYNSF